MPLQGIAPGQVAPEEMAATVPCGLTLGVPKEKRKRFNKVLGLQPESHGSDLYAIFRADTLSRWYVPAVMMGHDQPTPPSARTVHILGRDERSKFLSHALNGIYDSVKTVNMPTNDKYQNVSGNVGTGKHDGVWLEHNAALEQGGEAKDDNSHISNLVVAGRPFEAVGLLKEVKHRVDDRTAVCFMQDGLGIAEDANNHVFRNPKKRPSIVLGHMSHSLAYNRETDSVRLMTSNFKTALTGVRPYMGEKKDKFLSADLWLRTQAMLQKFAGAGMLKARGMQLDQWMKLKIPSLMFSAVVDPVCVVIDGHYNQLLENRSANRLVFQLLDEIADVVALMPEVDKSPEIHAMLHGEGIRKQVWRQIRNKKSAPSKMSLQIQRGQLTDIDYLNGFFVQRARRLGIKTPANDMVIGMIKAKHKAMLNKNRGFIPMEIASRLWTT